MHRLVTMPKMQYKVKGETFEVDGNIKYGIPLQRPAYGLLKVQELVTAETAREIDALHVSWKGGVSEAYLGVSEAYLKQGERELVLTDTILQVPVESMVRDGGLIIGRDRMKTFLRLEYPKVSLPGIL